MISDPLLEAAPADACVPYPTPEPVPQGVTLSTSPRGAPLYIMQSNPQRRRYGPGLTSLTLPAALALLPGQGPIRRGM